VNEHEPDPSRVGLSHPGKQHGRDQGLSRSSGENDDGVLKHGADEGQQLVALGNLVGQELVPMELLEVKNSQVGRTELGRCLREVDVRRGQVQGWQARVQRREGDVCSVERVESPFLEPGLDVQLVPLGVGVEYLPEELDLKQTIFR